jgi:hypothetical protein
MEREGGDQIEGKSKEGYQKRDIKEGYQGRISRKEERKEGRTNGRKKGRKEER